MNCHDGVYPGLVLRIRRIQEYATEQGYGDESAFLAQTFDPERNSKKLLREYAGQQGVDLDANSWHFLPPRATRRGRS
ncbi:hypothetical protein EKH57_16380 [Halorubrum sp. BOL3-1]|uniref:hypothetical protein n=1 Tax=Halorubrum sp. BOL3-1 TaxID=2497325 RepID=UPI001005245F|nr:hypothetical protein [Halorubrum sp. BOL3-1]QAU14133.1 hypothetical protein EKH57_16380 [Halorubrum sp. BOL3-1]